MSLFFMPMFPLLFILAKFFGPSFMGSLEGIERVVLFLLMGILILRAKIRFVLADGLILLCFFLSLLRVPLDSSLFSLAADFGFIIPYFIGRTIYLTIEQQARWAKAGIWLVAILAVAGMFEVFVLGEQPRTFLYMVAAPKFLYDGKALDPSFHAGGYAYMREASTMAGALQFAPMCMVAMVIWWVYSRKPIPGMMILAGLLCTVTRSAWVGAAVAIPLLGICMGYAKRVVLYGVVALVLLIIAIPFIGLGDYISSNTNNSNMSASQHNDSLAEGVLFVAQHPFGAGSENVSRAAVIKGDDGVAFEDAYLTIGGAYGIPVVLCLIAFMIELMRLGFRAKSKLGYTVFGIMIAFSIQLVFVAAHDMFDMVCWIWFPAGLLVAGSSSVISLKADA